MAKPSLAAPVSASGHPFILGIARSSTQVLDLAKPSPAPDSASTTPFTLGIAPVSASAIPFALGIARSSTLVLNLAKLSPAAPVSASTTPLYPWFSQIEHAGARFCKNEPGCPRFCLHHPFTLGLAKSSTQVLDLAKPSLPACSPCLCQHHRLSPLVWPD